ncbi:polysaccharide biosynthesis tyrosine autokinase [Nocardioides marmorisolisilvae]|uniref:non-specific protein-tyrosine kinase n=1 Tax=Nocardioides marmorisolisilvae TaxID=1542737 RepID=A0A3N0DPX8_9ACTN|nr:polysaccharide biosynthesis tyrosine autokinase [Nocardioides marmorisolisilvae]RNL77496.1 polysaccharide biosynthesis tyrosine autokinase [Nocardioides marmorisolisilvae]
MDFKELLRIVQRRWLTIVVFFLLGLLGGGALTYFQTPQYESTSKVFIAADSSSGDSNAQDPIFASYFAQQRVQSYAQLATSRELLQRVISATNLNLTPAQLSSKISSSVDVNTVIIQLKVSDESPAQAQKIAKAESEAFTSYLTELETSPVKATIVDPASYNPAQVSPKPALNLVIAGVLGLILGAGMALLRDLLDNTVSSASDVENTIDAPVLSSVAYDADVPKHPLLTEVGSHSTRVEAFRLLRTNLQFLDLDARPRALVITSAVPSEGKTSTATNLAIALAQTGLRVLLVDGDLRRPKVASVLGLERSVGMTTVLVGRSELQDSIQKHTDSGIYFLASGPIPPNPTEVLQSRAAQELFDRVSQMFDMVIIDGPPLLPVSDAAIMARDVDGAILVVRHGKTTKEQLKQAALRLNQVDANLLGVMVNMTPKRGGKGSGYGYGYGYAYGYGPEKHKS